MRDAPPVDGCKVGFLRQLAHGIKRDTDEGPPATVGGGGYRHLSDRGDSVTGWLLDGRDGASHRDLVSATRP